MAYVELRAVSKVFTTRDRKRFVALEGVNLQIEQGEFVSVIGHSGCGKSTVLNLLAGLAQVSAGEITVGGEPVRGPGPERMVAFQNHSLLPWLTLRGNIELAVDHVHGKRPAVERCALVDGLLDKVHLTAAAARLPGQVSGGMKQRCGIARAFACRPKLLLLDEPFGALDALTRANLQDELIRLWETERGTVLMITHDVDEALLLSDRIVMMSNGPAARVAEIMQVDLPRPRSRLHVVDHPSFYRQRSELLYYLNKCKGAKSRPSLPRSASMAGGLERQEIVVGFVPLLDCAPFAVAQAEDLFAAYGLKVTLSREPSWKAVSDGLREGRLDAAQMVAGMPISETVGLGGRDPFPIVSALTLNRGGNAITFGNGLRGARVTDRESFQRYLQKRRTQGAPPLTFGMVHPASMHNLLLRAWLAEGGIDPDLELRLAVIPPPQMVANLEQGNIAGFCVGEPWNTRAVRAGLGTICATDREIWPTHPEKVLGVSRGWAQRHPQTHLALVRSLLAACARCDNPEYRQQRLPSLLAKSAYVGGDPEDFVGALTGAFDYGDGQPRPREDFVLFSKNSTNLSRSNEMMWILAQLARWGSMAFPAQPADFIAELYVESVLREAAAQSGIQLAAQDTSALRIADSYPFDPLAPFDYLNALEIRREIAISAGAKPQSGKVVAHEPV
jgi:nitrate/nitrite transport system ATP-binding protein